MATRARTDWLAGAVVGILLVFGLVAALTVTGLARTAQRAPVTVAVPVADLNGTEPLVGAPQLVGGAVVDTGGTVDVRVDEPSTSQALWSLATWLPGALIGLTILGLLLTVARRARRGSPFTSGTVALLRAIGVVALLGGPIAIVLDGAAHAALTESVLASGGDPAPTVTLDWLVVGVGFLALAEVIRRGRGMRMELDEVI